MKYMYRILAGLGLWVLVVFGISLILQYTELSAWSKLFNTLLMLIGSVLFVIFHDSEGP